MRGRFVIGAGFILIVPPSPPGRRRRRWVDRTKADVRAGKASYHEVVDTVLKGER